MKKYRTHGLSFPDEALFEAAKSKAESEGRSLSNYVCRLIEKDVMQETPQTPPMPEAKPTTYQKSKPK